MALISRSNQGSPRRRRLGDHLREQQEPFVLEVYLRERGCAKKRIDNDGTISGCFFSSKCSGPRKSGDAAKGLSKIARILCNKLVLKNSGVGGESCSGVEVESCGRKEEEEESERLSFASVSTELNSMSDIEAYLDCVENQPELSKLVTGRMRRKEENKQYSPDSVLDEIQPRKKVYETPSTSRSLRLTKSTRDGVLSTSLMEIFSRSGSLKRAMQQSRRLLLDCVKEVVEKQGKAEQLVGPEELGRIISESFKGWSVGADNKMKITRMVRSELRLSFEEWEGFDGFAREIEREVGDRILEELEEELVEDLIAAPNLLDEVVESCCIPLIQGRM